MKKKNCRWKFRNFVTKIEILHKRKKMTQLIYFKDTLLLEQEVQL